jgi:hypothetical protein
MEHFTDQQEKMWHCAVQENSYQDLSSNSRVVDGYLKAGDVVG